MKEVHINVLFCLFLQTHHPGPGFHSFATCGISADVHSYDSWKTPVETWCISSKSFIITVIQAPVTFDSEPHYPLPAPLLNAASETIFNSSTSVQTTFLTFYNHSLQFNIWDSKKTGTQEQKNHNFSQYTMFVGVTREG